MVATLRYFTPKEIGRAHLGKDATTCRGAAHKAQSRVLSSLPSKGKAVATVAKTQRRVHVVMPAQLVEDVDALVGQRRRSRFITEAVEEKLGRRRRVEAFDRVVGSLADADISGWETREAAAQWVHDLRYHPEKIAPRDPDPDV
jgi:Arc/MetJ-type ribon-helix-helix transcriptional regulator